MNKIPIESVEQEMLATWLDFNKYTFSAIRNESDTHSFYKWKIRKRSWCRPWIPDFVIILKKWALLFIELKRKRKILKSWKLWASPSVVSEEQKQWKEKLNELENVACEICYWSDEAIKTINNYEL